MFYGACEPEVTLLRSIGSSCSALATAGVYLFFFGTGAEVKWYHGSSSGMLYLSAARLCRCLLFDCFVSELVKTNFIFPRSTRARALLYVINVHAEAVALRVHVLHWSGCQGIQPCAVALLPRILSELRALEPNVVFCTLIQPRPRSHEAHEDRVLDRA